jgi:hypothetical protein
MSVTLATQEPWVPLDHDLSKKYNTLSKQIIKAKRAGDVDQVVQYLSSKLKTEFKSQYCQNKKIWEQKAPGEANPNSRALQLREGSPSRSRLWLQVAGGAHCVARRAVRMAHLNSGWSPALPPASSGVWGCTTGRPGMSRQEVKLRCGWTDLQQGKGKGSIPDPRARLFSPRLELMALQT